VKIRMGSGDKAFLTFVYIVLIIIAVICIYPLVLTITTSFSDEKLLAQHGFRLIPLQWSLDTYNYVSSMKVRG